MVLKEVSMENKLRADFLLQGENLRHVVQHLYGAERENLEAAAAFLAKNDRPVLLIGVASAAYLCIPAEFYLGQHGRMVKLVYASDALYTQLPALHNANVVINSRSGETAEIVRLGQALVERGIPFAAVTNAPESTLAKMASHLVWTSTHQDDLVSINVVTGMEAAMLALAGAVIGQLDALKPDLERLPGVLDEVIEQALGAGEDMLALFAGVRPVYLLYRGHSRGAAYCGRLVLEEVARTPAVALEAAEFRQGPNEVVDERFAAVIFVPEGRQGELNLALARDLVDSGGRVMLVGHVSGIQSRARLLAFPLPAFPAALRPILEIVPVQALAYRLAEAQGYSPGEVRYISKVIRSEEGIPKQAG
jgi:glucosamine--fructose-6-phosphate aminotransferase (isomerizing)